MGPFSDALIALSDTGRRFVVVGGVAAVMQGAERATYDLDLVVDLERDACVDLVSALQEIGYRPVVPVDPLKLADPATREEWASRNMVVLSFHDTSQRRANVDLFVRYPLDIERLWANASTVEVQGRAIRVASPKELIEMKRAVGRDQDLADIAALERLHGRG